jgi:hypothetical protein
VSKQMADAPPSSKSRTWLSPSQRSNMQFQTLSDHCQPPNRQVHNDTAIALDLSDCDQLDDISAHTNWTVLAMLHLSYCAQLADISTLTLCCVQL